MTQNTSNDLLPSGFCPIGVRFMKNKFVLALCLGAVIILYAFSELLYAYNKVEEFEFDSSNFVSLYNSIHKYDDFSLALFSFVFSVIVVSLFIYWAVKKFK